MTRLNQSWLRKKGIRLPREDGNQKYNAKKTVIDGIVFDSKKEAQYYFELKVMKMAGKIKDFEVKPEKFVLQEAFTHKGVKIPAIRYGPDFKVIHLDGREEYVDVKGKKTEAYSIRKRLLLYKHRDINFLEV